MTGEWTELPCMLQPRQSAAMAALCARLYVFGGNDGNLICRSCECFDSCTNCWAMLPVMDQPRHGSAAAAINSPEDGRGVYICGGNDGTQSLCTAARFNPLRHSWESLSDMSQ